MEEVTLMMIASPDNSMNESIPIEPITTTTTTTTSPTWKLYENPFYNPQLNNIQHHHQQQHCQGNKHHLHHLHLPFSARKIAASFWDFTFFRPIMETELEIARTQIMELKAELEYERKARKKVETMNKRLAKELAEERRGREALERVCDELAREVSSNKAELDLLKREMEEERKMLRMAEVLREERVQMKLTEAKILFEEKLLQLEGNKQKNEAATTLDNHSSSKREQKDEEDKAPDTATPKVAATAIFSGKFTRLVFSEKSCDDTNSGTDTRESITRVVLGEKSSCSDNISSASSIGIQRKASPEPENPHIKRGIKGFVEFPKVVRAIGSKHRHWGTKLECQKAQLRILLKQKSPIRSNNLIIS
ncbi:hypothetical protein Tsubulata_026468 [Turnera subulata]|uniref:Protein BRANCHLESS TRICHOME n=1 Tax=Turnera subulata TaxID=218843 RepID=A0A9Q0JDJ3_9ROSI|nr:hypothetical protein Tsubulata_026468 [Turnera subulata]